MVAGLAFLSKKSWHTKNISNQERVWVAEQRKEQEEAKAKELAKQIQQEREQEEMDKIAGKRTTKIDRGIDWMYHGQEKNSEIAQEDSTKKSEEFLLGKAYVPEGQAVGDFDTSAQLKEGVNAVVEAKKPPPEEVAPPAYEEPSVADRNEAFRMRHEDPMFAVALEAKHKKDEYEKKKELYERVVGVRDEDGGDGYEADGKDRKRRKKDKKHKKKKKHRKRRHYSSDEDESSIEDRRDYHDRKRQRRSPTPDSHEDRRRRDSRSRDPDEYATRRRDRDDHHRRHRKYDDYSGDESHDRRDRRRRRDRSSEYRRDYERSRGPDPRDGRGEHDRYARDEKTAAKDVAREKKTGYGLQGKSLKAPPSDLGPDRELLRKKRQEREEQREQNRQQSSRRNLTQAEREAALRDMQESAARQHQSRHEDRPDEEDEVRHDPQSSAAFLHSVARSAHGVSDGSMSLHERISQNRNTNQRLHDDFV